jgi:3-oxoadipate enol-lactonase
MFVELRGHRCWYERTESPAPGAPRVLLMMGFGMSGLLWRPVARHLQDSHDVVLFDPRGIGQSTAGDGPHGLEHLADDAAALIDHLGWRDAHLVGVSMGGMVAQQVALRHRELARSLALVVSHGGPFRHTLPGPVGAWRFVAANTRKGDARIQALVRLLFPDHDLDTLLASGIVEPDELRAASQLSDPRIRIAHLGAILTHHTLPRLKALHDLPSLVVQASHDILVPPRCSEALHQAMPHSHIVRMAGVGHGVMAQSPDLLASHLAEHFARADAD